MPTATVIFRRLLQDSQDLGSDDEHMVSRLHFDMELNGHHHRNLYADLKQHAGGFFGRAPLEVSRPVGYKGPFNYEAFRDHAEGYFGMHVGGSGSGIRVGPGAQVRMRNNTFVADHVVTFDVSGDDAGW